MGLGIVRQCSFDLLVPYLILLYVELHHEVVGPILDLKVLQAKDRTAETAVHDVAEVFG